jgi:hypothetical protein
VGGRTFQRSLHSTWQVPSSMCEVSQRPKLRRALGLRGTIVRFKVSNFMKECISYVELVDLFLRNRICRLLVYHHCFRGSSIPSSISLVPGSTMCSQFSMFVRLLWFIYPFGVMGIATSDSWYLQTPLTSNSVTSTLSTITYISNSVIIC